VPARGGVVAAPAMPILREGAAQPQATE
jgi:hypothetical protein